MRCEDWEKRLNKHLQNVAPFEWSTNDCCQFTLGRWCELCTGINHLVSYKYKTEAGAVRILKRLGGLEALATKHLGEPKPPAMAHRGDIVSFEHDCGVALGICVGAKIAGVGQDGLMLVSMSLAKNAWGVK